MRIGRRREVMRVDVKPDWVSHFLTPDERQTLRAIARQSYSDAALRKLAGQPFTEEMHRQYGYFYDELRRLAAEHADPGSPEAQRLAGLLLDLNARRSQGDPEVVAGMQRSWENFNALPAEQKPALYTLTEAERNFIRQACAVLHQHGGTPI